MRRSSKRESRLIGAYVVLTLVNTGLVIFMDWWPWWFQLVLMTALMLLLVLDGVGRGRLKPNKLTRRFDHVRGHGSPPMIGRIKQGKDGYVYYCICGARLKGLGR